MMAIPKPKTNRPPTSCLIVLAVETMSIPATIPNPPLNIPTLRPQISEMGPAKRAYEGLQAISKADYSRWTLLRLDIDSLRP